MNIINILVNFSLIFLKAKFLKTQLTCKFTSNLNESTSSCPYGYTGSYCDECGLSFSKPNTKIVGGIEAIPHSWPSMALVVFRYQFFYQIGSKTYKSEKVSFCGGTLIDRKTVLTAAHCFVTRVSVDYNYQQYSFQVKPNEFFPTFESMYTVYLGVQNNSGVFNDYDISPGVAMSISSFTPHPNYDDTTNLNDIAIIKLSKDATLNCYVQPACLPNPSLINYPTKVNIAVWASGWGKLNQMDSTTPDTLYNVKMTLYSSSICGNVAPGTTKDWSKQICAGDYYGGKDTCQGDSGGPLFVKDIVNNVTKYILVGITSYGEGCGWAGYPGIYTRVSAYLSWIYQNSTANSTTKENATIYVTTLFNRVKLIL